MELKKYPKKTANQLKRDCNLDGKVSVDTIKRRLRDAGLFGRIAAKKSHISPHTVQRRRKWCIDRNHWDLTDWKKVISTDECKFELHPCRRQYVRGGKISKYDKRVVSTTRKFSKSIMV